MSHTSKPNANTSSQALTTKLNPKPLEHTYRDKDDCKYKKKKSSIPESYLQDPPLLEIWKENHNTLLSPVCQSTSNDMKLTDPTLMAKVGPLGLGVEGLRAVSCRVWGLRWF